jgi:hypothetical protein
LVAVRIRCDDEADWFGHGVWLVFAEREMDAA